MQLSEAPDGEIVATYLDAQEPARDLPEDYRTLHGIALLVRHVSSGERDQLTRNGTVIYNRDTNQLQARINGSWVALGAGGGGGGGPHAASHQPGGDDALAVDAAALTGSLRTLGTGGLQACAGNDSRLSNARTPLSHSHTLSAISDAGALAALNAVNTAQITDNAVSLAKLADLAASVILGRDASGTGDPQALTPAQVTAMLDLVVLNARGLVPPPGSSSGRFLRDDLAWANAAANITTVAIGFTDGETVRRVTVTDAAVSATSRLVGTIRRPNTTELDDEGFFYEATVVRRQAGSFDLWVRAKDWDGSDPVRPPNETVNFDYLVG